MGVLNVTPDSFSDGGRWADPEAAVAHARELIAQGADIIDIGGESTRPGAQRVDADTEISRVLPVVRALLADGAGASGSAIVSVDTIHAATAEAAIDAGAHIINDVSGAGRPRHARPHRPHGRRLRLPALARRPRDHGPAHRLPRGVVAGRGGAARAPE